MRKLSKIKAPILPNVIRSAPSYERRRVRAVMDSMTAIVMVRHDETETELFVSDDGDAVGAVWIPKRPVLVDPKDRGKFIVVTLTRTDARRFNFHIPVIFDRTRYLPEERTQLEDAIECAKRIRFRFSGQSSNRPTWSGGRNVYA